jgi:hypothetical protein
MKFIFDFLKTPIYNILFISIIEWGDNDHYMVCIVCEASIPTCFESIMMHVIRPKHVQKQ